MAETETLTIFVAARPKRDVGTTTMSGDEVTEFTQYVHTRSLIRVKV